MELFEFKKSTNHKIGIFLTTFVQQIINSLTF